MRSVVNDNLQARKDMVLDYLVTRIRGKRGPIQNALVYSLPYVPVILGTGVAGLFSPWLRYMFRSERRRY
jgi:hypothetical protein